MTLDPSVTNVSEYYSSHYLAGVFRKDLRETIARWREEGAGAVPRRLQRLGSEYLRAKEEALDVEDVEARGSAGERVAGWHARLLAALGYGDLDPVDLPVEGDRAYVPCRGRVQRFGRPWLVICEAPFCLPDASLRDGRPTEVPLELSPRPEQLVEPDRALCAGDWTRAIGRVFTEEEAPRWVLLLAGSEVLLLDQRTFAQGRWLRFDLDEMYARRERTGFEHVAALLSAETLCPAGESDGVLHDKLETQSHRFAHGVTEKLQGAVREAIELLANEWVEHRRRRQLSYRRRVPGESLPEDDTTEITAEHLKREALIYVYRLLFCFYAEARGGELGILPVTDDAYLRGYSLEALRDLELVPLTVASEEGLYFDRHLKRLFSLIHRGFAPRGRTVTSADFATRETARAFSMRPLTATLFDPKETPLFDRAEFRNGCLQRVIALLSLSVDDRTRSRGRVNYAELGINQLGAVYEGLLSYRGMFAEEDLIHVKPAGKPFGEKKTPTWFVPVDRAEDFRKEEIERLEGGKLRVYPPGTFILHLSGIDREQSASYYTPEVLTRCLVEEALRELLDGYGPEDADRILELRICEPAMGSGAFLNEATVQLAARYLELKQKQTGESIDPADYPEELRRARHHIATRNVYGVDLNPMAVELGALSLWLASIHRLRVERGENGAPDRYRPGATPWFGLRLRCGNSLVGARRAVWTREQLRAGRHGGKADDVPRLLAPGEARGADEVYHFLVFDEEMAPAARDRQMRAFWPERCAAAGAWQKRQVKPRWREEEVEAARRISKLVDEHWAAYSERRLAALRDTACTASVWPTPPDSPEALAEGPSLEEQERAKAELERASGSFQRLKLLMDAWCALWYWPLGEAERLPEREAWLASARLLLGDPVSDPGRSSILSAALGFDLTALLRAAGEELPDASAIADAVPWYETTRRIALEEPFHHWELVFPEVLGEAAERRGFDLVLGNPPWIKVSWADAAVLAEIEPLLGVREAKSATYNRRRGELIAEPVARALYADAFRRGEGSATVLNCRRLYPELARIQTNLYKNFIVRSWGIAGEEGVVGLLHPEGPYDDAKGGAFRAAIYPRLRAHLHLKNELKLFPDVHNETDYSINVYGNSQSDARFRHLANLFRPETVERCLTHDRPADPVPGIKTAEGAWETRPHAHRVVTITGRELEVFARLLEDEGTPALEARLPQLHARELLEVVRKIAAAPRRLKDLDGRYHATVMFDETYSQRDGLITREESPSYQPETPGDWVLSGPHFFVGTPLAKSSRTHAKSNRAYDDIDLTEIGEEYLPRAVYRPGDAQGDRTAFERGIPRWPGKEKVTARYRYVNREMVSLSTERSLVSAIVPKGCTHIHPVFSLVFDGASNLVAFASVTHALITDFLVRATGKGHCNISSAKVIPIVVGLQRDSLTARALRLNCLTLPYADLWREVAGPSVREEAWTSDDARLENEFEHPWAALDPDRWEWKTPLRTDFSRRLALVEIDVLVAQALGLTLDELATIYRVQFPVLQQYERADEYDAGGRRLPNTARKDAGGKEVRAAREDRDGTSPLTVTWPVDGGERTVTRTFHPPFERVDREEDYARAWAAFEERFKE